MKKLKLLLGALTLFGVFSVVINSTVGAQTIRSGTNTTLPSTEVVDGSLFASGRTVDIAAEVKGDVYCAGQSVTVTGHVHGDVLCAAQTLRVDGQVDGDVRLAGQTVMVSGAITGNATVGAQTFTLDSKGKIGGDITLGSSDATLNGSVGRDVILGGENVVLASKVGRNVLGATANLRLVQGASIGGKLDYTSQNQLQKDNGAVVAGEITRHEPKEQGRPKRGAVFGFGIGWFIYWLLALLSIAFAFALLMPRLLQRFTTREFVKPWRAFLVGFLASIAVPIALVMLMFTFIGIPLAIILGLGWLLIALLSGPVTGFYIGKQLLPDSDSNSMVMLAGMAVLVVLYFLPIIGFIVLLSGFWFGSGVLVLELVGRGSVSAKVAETAAVKRKHTLPKDKK